MENKGIDGERLLDIFLGLLDCLDSNWMLLHNMSRFTGHAADLGISCARS